MADWSSLPSDLVRRIADCLLSTNDLDCYMDFRAVCPSWRSATDDPTNSSDLRFRPLHWIIVDEVFQSERARLLVNTSTGRVVRKDLPLLRRFYVVATTHGGFFVLAGKEPPHAARILNPFTGHMIVFTASVPYKIDISAAALGDGAPFPTLGFLSDRWYELYTAAVDSKAFIRDNNRYGYLFMRLLVAGGACADGEETIVLPPTPGALPKKLFALMKLFDIHPDIGLADYAGHRHANSCFLVKSGTRLLAVIMLQHQFKVFNLTTSGDEPAEPMKSIGDHAIFLGYRRCVCVSAEKFPSVVANCIYYLKKHTNSSLNIYKYDLQAGKEEMVSKAVDSLNPETTTFANFPLITVIQLLSSYTINVRVSQLPKAKLQFGFLIDNNILRAGEH